MAPMLPFTSSEFSRRALVVFIWLQALDVLTTIIGMRLGAGESSVFIGHLMRLGPLTGLLLSKVWGLILITAAVMCGRGRLLRILNPWYAAVVTWNLVAIIAQSHFPPHV